jgi:hypothetical protein
MMRQISAGKGTRMAKQTKKPPTKKVAAKATSKKKALPAPAKPAAKK